MWPTEQILDPFILFLRVHDNNIQEGKLLPVAFAEHGDGTERSMSTDWSQYSTVAQTRDRAKNPDRTSVVSLITGLLRYYGLEVSHAPLDINRAHTDVKGVEMLSPKVRLKLLNNYDWEQRSAVVLGQLE